MEEFFQNYTFIDWIYLIGAAIIVVFLVWFVFWKSGTASGRGNYGTIRGNVVFFGSVALLLLSPYLLWGPFLLFDEPKWLHTLMDNLVRTLVQGLSLLVAIFLVVYPWFAKKFIWGLEKDPNTGNIIENKPRVWLEPFSFRVEEGRAVARTGDSGGVVDYTMRQGDADIQYDKKPPSHRFTSWSDRYSITATPGSPSDVPVYSAWHWYHKVASGGLIFGGFYWYLRLHTYDLDIVKAEIGAEGKIKLQILPGSRTDHVRVRKFAWAVIVEIRTKELLIVTLLITFELRCVNPDKTLFGIDRWERIFSQRVSGKAIDAGRSISVLDLLGAAATVTRNHIAAKIDLIRNDIQDVTGLEILDVQVPGYLQIGRTDAEGKRERDALTAEGVAKEEGKAKRVLGDAEAYIEAKVVRERGTAAASTPHGEAISLHQALEAAAEKGGTVFANLGTGGDAMSQAILTELQRINVRLGGTP